MKRQFPQVLKGAATATANNIARTGTVGRKKKHITMPKMPWDDEKDIASQHKEDGATAADKQHHLAGLVWMIHKDTREKKRVKLTEITMYEKQGFERGGPRSK